MVSPEDTKTRATLLERLRQGSDPMAWDCFYERYWRSMFAFAKRYGCSDQTAEDVVQDVMLAVFQQRHVFRYDPARGRFRNWLCTVVKQKLALRRRKEPKEQRLVVLQDVEDGGPKPVGKEMPHREWDDVFEKTLLLALMDVVRREVNPKTYQAFELTTLHELSGGEAAKVTGLSRNGVYLARKRVLRRLRELGAPYSRSGALGQEVRDALGLQPGGDAERELAARVGTAMSSIGTSHAE